ncbi:MAG: 5-(carboxyamino)imidazole ribonucleotide mutase [Thermotogae bacterium]|nr:5-(carboxyamino)imidazole ribonucleotide mutase [Thermotogota bacterium]
MRVALIVGSTSDLTIVKEAYEMLRDFNVDVEVRVLSAHRTPEELKAYVKEAEEKGIEVFIAAAGKAAHLPGVIASLTTLPVIGLPVPAKYLYGVDALLSIVQMPPGIPVATVGVGEARNAALLAVQILSLKYDSLRASLKDYRERLRRKVLTAEVSME